MNSWNIIADIAGQYDCLLELIEKMPKDSKIVAVGDLMDRGPKSKEVIQWFIDHPEAIALKGNHEDIMLDWVLGPKKYTYSCWLWNGGDNTIWSYGAKQDDLREKIPKEHIEFLSNLPLFLETDDLIVTHAPVARWIDDIKKEAEETGGYRSNHHQSFLWNRSVPKKRDKFQIFGHNSPWGFCWFDNPFGLSTKRPTAPEGAWAACIDDSANRKLTGIHWPTLEVFQVDYPSEV